MSAGGDKQTSHPLFRHRRSHLIIMFMLKLVKVAVQLKGGEFKRGSLIANKVFPLRETAQTTGWSGC